MAFARFRPPAALALAAGLVVPLAAVAGPSSHFSCHVTGTSQLDRLGRDGRAAELSRFTCTVRGGLLDGFVASGTNIWEPGKDRAVLLGSIVVAHKAGATVVYEVEQATRKRVGPDGRAGNWHGAGRGTYKLATGSAVALAGRTFRTVARRDGPDTFSIDSTLID